jgi:hypothetical protein
MNFLPSIGVLCANEPPAALSRARVEFMSTPVQKMCKDISSGID